MASALPLWFFLFTRKDDLLVTSKRETIRISPVTCGITVELTDAGVRRCIARLNDVASEAWDSDGMEDRVILEKGIVAEASSRGCTEYQIWRGFQNVAEGSVEQ